MLKKISLAFITTTLALIVLGIGLELASMGYFRLFPKHVSRDMEAPIDFRAPPEELKYALAVDWSFHPLPDLRLRGPGSHREELKKNDHHYIRTNTGWVAYPDSHRQQVTAIRSSGDVVYDVAYTFDSRGRRNVPEPTGRLKQPELHLAFFGCSHTFGEGLIDRDTLPFQFGQHRPEFQVYNLARQGGSIADAIAGITTHHNWEGLTPAKGILAISFKGDVHVPRMMGTAKTVGTWNAHGTWIDEENGKYVFKGILGRDRPLWLKLSRLIASSSFLSLIKFDWPPINDQAFAKYAKAISDLRDYYLAKYPGSAVLVFLNPGAPSGEGIIRHLEMHAIHYLNYTHMPIDKMAQKPLRIPYDRHTSGELNRILAEQLAHDLSNSANRERLL